MVESVAVVIAVAFAIVQVRQYRRDKHRESAVELLHSFQTPQFAKALNIVFDLPDGLSMAGLTSSSTLQFDPISWGHSNTSPHGSLSGK